MSQQREWHHGYVPDIHSFPEIREALMELVEGDELVKRVILACDEAYTNICQYSGATEAIVDVTFEGDVVSLRLTDDGVAFDPIRMEEDLPDFDDLEHGGMGIIFMKDSSDEIDYRREDGRNVLTMRFVPNKA